MGPEFRPIDVTVLSAISPEGIGAINILKVVSGRVSVDCLPQRIFRTQLCHFGPSISQFHLVRANPDEIHVTVLSPISSEGFGASTILKTALDRVSVDCLPQIIFRTQLSLFGIPIHYFPIGSCNCNSAPADKWNAIDR